MTKTPKKDAAALSQRAPLTGALSQRAPLTGALQALADALHEGNPIRVDALLASGVDPNAFVGNITLLFYALNDGGTDNPALVARLLNAGAEVDKTIEKGARTALSEAALRGKSAICELLVARGANVTFAKNGRGVLHAASQGGVLWLVERVLAAGVDPNAADSRGETPLHDACYAGRLSVAERLIAGGADVNAVVRSGAYAGFTPLKFAVTGGFPRLTEKLLAHGAEIPSDRHPLAWLLEAISAENDYGERPKTPHIAAEIKIDIAAATVRRAQAKPPAPTFPEDGFVQTALVLLEHGGAPPPKLVTAARGMLKRSRAKELVRAIRNDDAGELAKLLKEGVPRPKEQSLIRLAAEVAGPEVIRVLLDAGDDPNDFEAYVGTPLHVAVQVRNVPAVKALIEAGADVNRWTEPEGQEEPDTPLCVACSNDDLQMVKLLLGSGASADPGSGKNKKKKKNDFLAQFLPITKARSPAIITVLLEHGARPDPEPSLLVRLADDGDVTKMRLLLEAGADPNKVDDYGESPLTTALEGDSEEMVRLLLKHGATLGKKKPPSDISPAFKAILRERRGASSTPEKISFRDAVREGMAEKVLGFIARGQDINKPDKEETVPLSWAIKAGQEAMALLLLKRGAEPAPNVPYPPLYHACEVGMEVVVGELLKRGADPRPVFPFVAGSETLLHLAARRGHIGVMKRLLDAGLPADHGAPTCKAAIFPAAYWLRTDLVRLLIERGADVNRRFVKDHSVLAACFEGFDGETSKEAAYFETFEMLLDAGAEVGLLTNRAAEGGRVETLMVIQRKGKLDPSLHDTWTPPPLMLASRNGHALAVRFLLRHGADPDFAMNTLLRGKNRTAMHEAAAEGHAKVVQALLDGGARPDLLDGEGRSPLEVATSAKVRAILRKAGAPQGHLET